MQDASRISFIDGLEISCMKALVFYRFSTGILKSIICNRHGLKWSNSMAIFQSNLVQYILCSSFLRSQIDYSSSSKSVMYHTRVIKVA